jgi:hypothetical protein
MIQKAEREKGHSVSVRAFRLGKLHETFDFVHGAFIHRYVVMTIELIAFDIIKLVPKRQSI